MVATSSANVNIGKLRLRQDLGVELFRPSNGMMARFPVRCRIDNQTELDYFKAGGVMPYVLRNLAGGAVAPAPGSRRGGIALKQRGSASRALAHRR